MKQLSTLLQVIIFSLIPAIGMAEEFVVDGITYEFWEEDMNTLRIISTEEFVQKSIDANILSIKLPSEVTAPDGQVYPVACLGTNNFNGVDKIESLYLPETIEFMEYYCISDCDDLTFLDLGNNLRNIGGFCLSELPKLREIKLPETLTYINESSFCGLYSLEHIDFPDSLKYISEYSVCGLSSVRHIDMSNMPTCSFVTHAFSGFNELETLVLPQCVSQFPPDSFGFMPKLRELTLPLCGPDNEYPWVDEDSFQNLPLLEKIYNPNTTPPNQYNQERWIVFGETIRDNATPLDYESCILFVPEGCVEAYRSNPGWNKFVHIEEYSKAGSRNIEEITSKSPVEFTINSTRLTIKCVRTADVMICDLSGRAVFKRAISGSETIDLPEGVYLFRLGAETTKIFIKQ